MRTFLIAVLLLASIAGYTSEVDDIKHEVRNFLVRVLGEKKVQSFWFIEKEITLPLIPTLKKDPKKWNTKVIREVPKVKEEVMDKHNAIFVQEIYAATRMTEIPDQDFQKWFRVLRQGGTREGVYRAFVLDEYYAGLENNNERLSDALKKEISKILLRFLNQNIDENNLDTVNFFTLKRVISENLLELLDILVINEEEMQNWYAVFSSDLAKNYPNVWNNIVRKKTDPKYHKIWASKVHLQMIKSETLIKFHKLLNFLQAS